jgi:hypothetical protein
MVLYEIYREDGGNGITFVHMLYTMQINKLNSWSNFKMNNPTYTLAAMSEQLQNLNIKIV